MGVARSVTKTIQDSTSRLDCLSQQSASQEGIGQMTSLELGVARSFAVFKADSSNLTSAELEQRFPVSHGMKL